MSLPLFQISKITAESISKVLCPYYKYAQCTMFNINVQCQMSNDKSVIINVKFKGPTPNVQCQMSNVNLNISSTECMS